MGGVFDQLKRFNVVPPKKQSIKSLRFQTEEIFFDDLKIYVKRKAYRRQMGIYVYPTGKVVVCVNQGASQSQINLFLEAQKNWIRKKLLLFSELKGTHPLK